MRAPRPLLCLAALGLALLGCEHEPAHPDVAGRWAQEHSAGREWVEFFPGGRAVVHSFTEGRGRDATVELQWYWVGDDLMLRGAGGLSQRVAVSGDRMTMADGTVLVRQRGL